MVRAKDLTRFCLRGDRFYCYSCQRAHSSQVLKASLFDKPGLMMSKPNVGQSIRQVGELLSLQDQALYREKSQQVMQSRGPSFPSACTRQ